MDSCCVLGDQPAIFLYDQLQIPGDKSISHRVALVASLANNITDITGFLESEDCLATLQVLKALGVSITRKGNQVRIVGKGRWAPPTETLDVGNSGTLIRLLTGLLAACPFEVCVTGDASIQKRPLKRVLEPLSEMGLGFRKEGKGAALAADITAPVFLKGTKDLKAISYKMPVASAQVKSALLFAALFAKGTSEIIEPVKTRDHTERMLSYYGADVSKKQQTWSLKGGTLLRNPYEEEPIVVPADLSSASFFIVLAMMQSRGAVTLSNIGLNPTRTGLLDVLKQMGIGLKTTLISHPFEPVGTLTCEPSPIKNSAIPSHLVPNIIDEIPILIVLASKGAGEFVISDAKELRVKESDRLAGIERLFKAAKLPIVMAEDGLTIVGPMQAETFVFDAKDDHRLAMSAIVLALAHHVPARVTGCASIATSFPNFFDLLTQTGARFRLED